MDEIVRTSGNPLRPVEHLHSLQLLSDPNPTPKLLRSFPPLLVTHFLCDAQSLKTASAMGQVLSVSGNSTTRCSVLRKCITCLSYTLCGSVH